MTFDRSSLGKWIQPQHLDPDALRGYRESFATSPVKAVVLKDFLHPHLAERVSRFLTSEARFETGYGSWQHYGLMSEEAFLALPEPERFFRFGMLVREQRPSAMRSPHAATYLALVDALGEPWLRAFFEAATGLALGAVSLSVRAMRRGDFLAFHDDDIADRRLSFFLYLTPGWERRFGGDLVMERSDGGHEIIVPEYNSIAFFDVKTRHRVAPFEEALGERARVAVGGWFRRGADAGP